MEKRVIVVGDKTSHGGTVITGNPILEVRDQAVACVGDSVHCPLHGETQIIEGFEKAVIEPGGAIAYEGCLTSCGAQLLSSRQNILVVELPTPVALNAHEDSETEEEFHLLVATVWGEGASQSPAAWQAIASVIINRVGQPYWKKDGNNKSVTTIIKKTGFDAAQSNKNKAFFQAYHYLSGDKSALNAYEKKVMEKMISLLKPIYYDKKTTTIANHYYSPKEQERQHKKHPSQYPTSPEWIKKHKIIEVSHLSKNDDLIFTYGA